VRVPRVSKKPGKIFNCKRQGKYGKIPESKRKSDLGTSKIKLKKPPK